MRQALLYVSTVLSLGNVFPTAPRRLGEAVWMFVSYKPLILLIRANLERSPRSRGQVCARAAQKSGLSALGISDTEASNAMLFSAQIVSSSPPARVR